MSDDGQESATSTNADVMGEVMQGSNVGTMEAAARQYSVGDASMIAQAGDANALTENLRTSPSINDSQLAGQSDKADAKTPNVKPDALDSKASPMKRSPGSPNVASSSQGHAKQDLNEKLADAAPGNTQLDGSISEEETQPNTSKIATPAAREASSVEARHDTPSPEGANGQPDTPNGLHNADVQQSSAANRDAGAEPISVKKLIQRRSSDSGSPTEANTQQTPPVRRKTEDELPEGIRALKNRFTGATPSSDSPSPQPIPLPKVAVPQISASPVHLEVEHKPGSRFWPYKELKDLRIENGIDPTCKEEYLTEDEFSQVFKKWDLNRSQFKAQPVWRQRIQKQTVGLF